MPASRSQNMQAIEHYLNAHRFIQFMMAASCASINLFTRQDSKSWIADFVDISLPLLFLLILAEHICLREISPCLELFYLPAGMILFLMNGVKSFDVPYNVLMTLSTLQLALIRFETLFSCMCAGFFFACFVGIGDYWTQLKRLVITPHPREATHSNNRITTVPPVTEVGDGPLQGEVTIGIEDTPSQKNPRSPSTLPGEENCI